MALDWTDQQQRKRAVFLSLGAGFVLFGGILVLLISFRHSEQYITHPKHIFGDLNVGKREVLHISGSAPVTVSGNLSIEGMVTCEDGPLLIIVEGSARVAGTLTCINTSKGFSLGGGRGISLVVKGDIDFLSTAKVSSNGAIEVVDSNYLLATSTNMLVERYLDTTIDRGGPTRLGPFVPESATQQITASLETLALEDTRANTESGIFFPRAYAKSNSTSISGTWIIGNEVTTPENQSSPRVVPSPEFPYPQLNILTSENRSVTLKQATFLGADGLIGSSDSEVQCLARGGKGGNGAQIHIDAYDITIQSLYYHPGDGGSGGNSASPPTCPYAEVIGGDGGLPGNFKFTASHAITIKDFRISTQKGGDGGTANANTLPGASSCPGGDGGEAIAFGGRGADAKAELTAFGTISGAENIIVSRITGGKGGEAMGHPGAGGNGTGCGCPGGRGGNLTSTGGKGGNANLRLIGSTGEAQGGDGGNASGVMARGGDGGSCTEGGNGGRGGDGGGVKISAGPAGKGLTLEGVSGKLDAEIGGTGGNGGTGCPPGPPGVGGPGAPRGESGSTGTWTCAHDTKTLPAEAIRGLPSGFGKFLQFENTHLIPIEQLVITSPDKKCTERYWVGRPNSIVHSVDGTILDEPSRGCGFGAVSSSKTLESIPEPIVPKPTPTRTGIPKLDEIVTP